MQTQCEIFAMQKVDFTPINDEFQNIFKISMYPTLDTSIRKVHI